MRMSLASLVIFGLLLTSCDSRTEPQPDETGNGKPSPEEKDTSLYKAMESDLDIIVHREGDMRYNGRKIVSGDKPFELEKLAKVVELRRFMKKYQEEPGNDNGPVNYRMRIIIDPRAHFRNIQVILMTATRLGGVKRFLLTHDAKYTVAEVTLPWNPGKSEELARVNMCVGEIEEHLKDKPKHDRKKKEGVVLIYIGDREIGSVDPLGDRSKIMKKLGEAVAAVEKTRKNPEDFIVLDADEEVESMVILHTLKTLKDHGSRNIQLIGNVRLGDKLNAPFKKDD